MRRLILLWLRSTAAGCFLYLCHGHWPRRLRCFGVGVHPGIWNRLCSTAVFICFRPIKLFKLLWLRSTCARCFWHWSRGHWAWRLCFFGAGICASMRSRLCNAASSSLPSLRQCTFVVILMARLYLYCIVLVGCQLGAGCSTLQNLAPYIPGRQLHCSRYVAVPLPRP